PDRVAAAFVRFHTRSLHRNRRNPMPAKAVGFTDPLSGTLKKDDVSLRADQLDTRGSVKLCNTEAAGTIWLSNAKLGGDLDCTGIKLTKTTDCLIAEGLDAKGCAFLDRIRAEGTIRLSGAKLGGDLSFTGAKLTQKGGTTLYCSGAKITGTWFWRDGVHCVGAIDLSGAEIDTITDDPQCWPAEILLDRCRYGAFTGTGVSGRERIDWLSRMKPQKYGKDFWPQPYEECARALREAGHGADAREVLIEKERLQRQDRHARLGREYDAAKGKCLRLDIFLRRWLLRCWDRIIWLTVAYGRRPLQAIVPLMFLWLIGSFIFGAAAWSGQIKPNLPQIQRTPEWVACGVNSDLGAIPERQRPLYLPRANAGETQMDCFLRQPEAAAYPRFDPLIYSADTLLPIVSLEMQSYWIPDDRKPIGWWARFYLWLHIFAGWGLTLLAVAGFSGLIKTDNTK
ncbi:MAG: hypothetical protein ACK5LJ_08885, partial [Paracoccus sp. (in: a-proteobacteria)]